MLEADRISALTAHWKRIEVRLKEAEGIRSEVVMPAINELRYAGRRVIAAWEIYNSERDGKVLSTSDVADFDRHLVAAGEYLWNADHDITDAVCSFASDKLRRTLETYGIGEVATHFPGVNDFYNLAKDAETKRSSARGCSLAERRRTYDELAADHVPKLVTNISLLHDAEVRSLRHHKALEHREFLWKMIALASFIITVLSLFVSAVGTIKAFV